MRQETGGFVDLSALVRMDDFEVKRIAEHDGEVIWIRPLPSRSFALCVPLEAAKSLSAKLGMLLGEPVAR